MFPPPAQSTPSHKWVEPLIIVNKLVSIHTWTCQIMDVYDQYRDSPPLQPGKVTLVTEACQNTGSGEWHTGGRNGNIHRTITSQSTSTPALIPFTTLMSTHFLLILNIWNGVVMTMALAFCWVSRSSISEEKAEVSSGRKGVVAYFGMVDAQPNSPSSPSTTAINS